MRLKKYEICLIALTAAVMCFGAGYFIGRGKAPDVITVKTERDSMDTITVENSDVSETEDKKNTDTSADDSDEDSVQSSAGDGGKVNINTADIEELSKLSGIGPVLAERIVKYREENGNFASVEALSDVYGIGETIINGIIDEVTVG